MNNNNYTGFEVISKNSINYNIAYYILLSCLIGLAIFAIFAVSISVGYFAHFIFPQNISVTISFVSAIILGFLSGIWYKSL